MGKYKKFDADLYRENDGPAIRAVLRELDATGVYATVNPDKYGPDVIVYSGFRPLFYVEVECKRVWNRPEFPWNTLQIPLRKKKFLSAGLPIEFWILNSTMDSALIAIDAVISSSITKNVPNSMVSDGEEFFDVPLDQCIYRRFGNDAESNDSEAT